MTRPGDRLRSFAARWCSADTLDRVIDPLVADLQAEHHEAVTGGRVWRGRWIRIVGVMAFIRVVATCAVTSTARTMTTWPADDRRALVRTIGVSLIAVTAFMGLLLGLPVLRYPQRAPTAELFFYLIPMAIPIALAFGFPFGAFLGLGAVSSSRLRASVLALALLCSVASFLTMSWIAPNANQAYREAVYTSLVASSGQMLPADLRRGMAELTRTELKERIDQVALQHATTRRTRRELETLTLRYHLGSALPCAAVAIGLFAIAAIPRRQVRAWLLVTSAFGVSLGYYFLIVVGHSWGMQHELPAFLAAWLPNLVFGALAGILMVRSALLARHRPIS
jgi:lipopolysaccharide export LptBFGC system permease protein LptF